MDGAYPEPWIERLIREASDDGEFDDVPGHGKPIPHLDRRYEPSWWARTWVAREQRSEAAMELAALIRRTVPRVLVGTDPAAIRAELAALNDEIAVINEGLVAADRLPELDIDRLLADRRHRFS